MPRPTERSTTDTAPTEPTTRKTPARKTAAKSTTKKTAAKSTTARKTAAKSTTKTAGAKSTTRKTASRKTAAESAKPASARKTAKPSSARKPAKTTSRRGPTKSPRAATPPARATARQVAGSDARRAARALAAAGRVVAWMREHAAGDLPESFRGAREASLKALERELGTALPPDLSAFWRAYDGGVGIFEYSGTGCARARYIRKMWESLRRKGTFEDHEIFPQKAERIARTKWHPGWIPLAEDGGGNLYCVDVAPGRAGKVGQVIRWEMRGGAFAASSVFLADVLERYADALESGRFTFMADSGIYDGPYLDLLAPK